MHAISKIMLALALASLLALGAASLASTHNHAPQPSAPASQPQSATSLDPLGMEWSEAWDIVMDAPRER